MLPKIRAEEPSAVTQKLLTRDALLCVLLVCICLLIAWPIAEMGINDDWSYLLTTQAFARTHHFIYNGWSTAMLGWQVLWGAVFAWLIRPDFVGIRLSTIPIALAATVFYHAILRNFGLNRAHALFGTLALVLSPLFLGLSATYMSDIPGLLTILVCIYLCQRALAARADRHAALWLTAAALTNIVGGTVRQATWLGILVIVPCCAWLLRRRRYIVPLAVILWVSGAVSIKLLIAWFFRHPYSIPLALIPKEVDLKSIWHLSKMSRELVTTSLLLIFPVLVTGVAARWPPKKWQLIRTFAGLLAILAIVPLSQRMGKPDFPDSLWMGNIITPYGIMQTSDLFYSFHRVPVNGVAAVFAIVILCAISFACSIYRPRAPIVRVPEMPGLSWREMYVLLLPFLAFYVLLLFPLAINFAMIDRYLLETTAVLLMFALRWHQERVSQGIPAIAIAALVVSAMLGVMALHDLFSFVRAEVRLTNELQQAGVPRTEVRGGFDFDMVTEAYTAGYVNDPHLVNPPGSFHPLPHPQSGPCADAGLIYLPAMNIKYVLTAGPRPCTTPTSFPPQSFRTWLPPGRRELFVVARQLPVSSATSP